VETDLITVTLLASKKLKSFMKMEDDKTYLRIYVQGGGCSGLSYGMVFEKAPEEDDLVMEENGIKILVDTSSIDHLKGTEIDYAETLMGAGFKLNNPNVKKSCSCGSSFSTS